MCSSHIPYSGTTHTKSILQKLHHRGLWFPLFVDSPLWYTPSCIGYCCDCCCACALWYNFEGHKTPKCSTVCNQFCHIYIFRDEGEFYVLLVAITRVLDSSPDNPTDDTPNLPMAVFLALRPHVLRYVLYSSTVVYYPYQILPQSCSTPLRCF